MRGVPVYPSQNPVSGQRRNAQGASGTILEPLRMSAAASELVAIGQNPAPLPLVGQFLGQVGAVVKETLDSCDTSACLCDTRVRAARHPA